MNELAPELNEPQAEAVAHAEGPLLVFAGAGSGKTRVITYRIANLLANHRVPPYRILAVTFTNKAAGELRGRLEKLAGADVTRDLWAGTFHSVCARLLRRHHEEAGLDRGFVIYDDTDQKAVMTRLLKEMGLDERRVPPRYALSRIHAEKREGRLPGEVDISHGFDELLVEVFERYEKALATMNAVDFEDLILKVMRLAEDPNSHAGHDLRTRFDHVLVDEFQDTNITQYRLVRALSARTRNLCVVGDDDQSIYRWRGADVRLIRGFRRDFPDATVIKLEQNYRSSANIVAAALGVIKPSRDREPKRLWTASEAGELVQLRAVRDEREEAANVVAAVRQELTRGVEASDIAVFYRVHAQSRVLEEAFRVENIPYQIVGGTKFFERAEVKDLLAYLRLVENPKSDADLLRIINVPARGIGQKTVQKILDVAAERALSAYRALEAALRDDELGTGPAKKLQAFYDLMEGLRDAAMRLGPRDLAAEVLEATGYRDRLQNDGSAESDARLENLEELLGSIAEYEEETHEAGEPPTLSGYLERVSLVTAVDSMKNVPSVNLMTVHGAKGLEFTTVALTGMEEEIFPYRGLGATEIEELDEERRLAYVAITRARQRLLVTYANTRTLFGQTRYLSPSRFLKDLPPDVVRHEGAPSFGRSFGQPSWTPPRSASKPRPRPGERVVDRDAFDDIPPDMDGVVLRPGDRVRHRRFGQGIVESVETGGTPTVVARFPGVGSKRILAEYLEF